RMATVIATIHQPEHLPWLGFFNKADQADVLVLLDTVQFRKGYFQNRNRILGPNGLQWLTVPVILRGHTTRMLVDMEISNQEEWRSKHWKTIRQAYGHHPFFRDHEGFLTRLYETPWSRLTELNEKSI